MGDVKTTTKKDSRTATPAPPRSAASDPLTDPLSGGAQEHLADPLTSGGEGAVQMEGGGVLAGATKAGEVSGTQSNVMPLLAFANQLNQLSTKLNKAGDDIIFDDKDQLAAAATLADWAEKTTKAANSVDNWYTRFKGRKDTTKLGGTPQDNNRAGGAAKAIGHAKSALEVASLLEKLADQSTVKEFLGDIESKQKRQKWAKHVTGIFDKLGSALPGAIAETPMGLPLAMFKGYLSAPKNYLAAFNSVLDKHLGKLDKAANLDNYDVKLLDGFGGPILWAGPLTNLYAGASNTLADFMRQTQKRLQKKLKINLWNEPYTRGLALLRAEIVTSSQSEDTKAAWLQYLPEARA